MQDLKKQLTIWLFFGLLVGIMTLPALFTLSTHLIGNNVDIWVFYWNDWWLAQALSTGHPVLYTPYIFSPQGASLAAHSNSFLSSLLALPLRPVVGPVVAANLVRLCGLWIGAVGMFWLAHDLTRSPAGALVAGFIFTFAPYHITKVLAHPNLGFIHWWPWYALMLRRALQPLSTDRTDSTRKRTRFNPLNPRSPLMYALVASVFAVLTVWTGLRLAVMLALWTAVYVGWMLLQPPRSASRWIEMGKCLIVVALVTGIASAPLLIPIARDWHSSWTENFDDGAKQQTDLLAYLIPPTYHPLWGDQVQPIYERFIVNRAYMPYLGYTALFLALFVNGWKRKKSVPAVKFVDEKGFWLLTLALWVLLAAGSVLRVNGVLYETIRLPYNWIADVFPISTLRSPDRLNVLVVFSLAALAGYGAARLARRRRWLLPIGLLLLTEYLCLPFLRWELLPSSPFYAQMATDDADYAVLDYPMGYNEAKLWLYYQTLHGKPMVEGHVSRYTPELYTLITSNSLVRALYQNTLHKRPPLLPGGAIAAQSIPPEDGGAALRELVDLGVRYVLVHKPYVDAAMDAHFRRVLPFAPTYEDETLTVYDLAAPLAVTYDGFPITLSDDLRLARFDVQQPAPDVWEFQILAQLRQGDGNTPYPCTLALASETHEWASSRFTLFEELDNGVYTIGDLDSKEVAVHIEDALPPDEYHWRLTCNGASFQPVEQFVVTETGTLYTRPTSRTHFDDIMTLAGYRWRTLGNMLRLDFWWDVQRAPGDNYIRFVHVLAPDGALLAQYDTFPCAWACPTSEWEAGQRIHDGAELQLWNLPAGQYRIALGWYHVDTHERLPATDADGNPIADSYVFLEDVFVVQRQ